MTPLVTRLRTRIDKLTDERDAALIAIPPRRSRRPNRCRYCGDPCHGRACVSHRDLLAFDPAYCDALDAAAGQLAVELALPLDADVLLLAGLVPGWRDEVGAA